MFNKLGQIRWGLFLLSIIIFCAMGYFAFSVLNLSLETVGIVVVVLVIITYFLAKRKG